MKKPPRKALLRPSQHDHSRSTQALDPFPMLYYIFFRRSLHLRCLFYKNYSHLILVRNGEVTLLFGGGEGGPSERWEGGSAKVANAVLAFACPPGSSLVACRDDSFIYEGTRGDQPANGLLSCSG